MLSLSLATGAYGCCLWVYVIYMMYSWDDWKRKDSVVGEEGFQRALVFGKTTAVGVGVHSEVIC